MCGLAFKSKLESLIVSIIHSYKERGMHYLDAILSSIKTHLCSAVLKFSNPVSFFVRGTLFLKNIRSHVTE